MSPTIFKNNSLGKRNRSLTFINTPLARIRSRSTIFFFGRDDSASSSLYTDTKYFSVSLSEDDSVSLSLDIGNVESVGNSI
ncbi:hypothetical protein HanIR_Chr03g0130701 [Helianthus annuus]|nr:hypothetical protein HanIR_Chr03g0130701 [Helianthus annuus]